MLKNLEKDHLRKRMLAKLAALAKNEVIRRSENAAVKLSGLSCYKKSEIILFYYPLGGEVDLRKVIRKAFLTKKVCLPATDLERKKLKVYQIDSLECGLVKGAFGINEPNEKKAKEVDIKKIDTVIVPGLAFSHKKDRLGRGGGFYDRFLQELSNFTRKIGVAFDFQILENLPVNLSEDQRVDLVVTDSRIIE